VVLKVDPIFATAALHVLQVSVVYILILGQFCATKRWRYGVKLQVLIHFQNAISDITHSAAIAIAKQTLQFPFKSGMQSLRSIMKAVL